METDLVKVVLGMQLKDNSEFPLVSISCIAYNQHLFIKECLDGFLMQRTSFSFEIIIHDDASTDGTKEIIEDYAKKYPNIIFPIYQKENQYSKGVKPTPVYNFPRCRGKYIALCEGDDYWTDPYKLQKQVDFLDSNSGYVACFHKVQILQTDGTIVKDFITSVPENYETQEALARFGNYIHTPSVVFRNCIKEFPFEFELTPIGDYFLYVFLAEYGKFKHIEEEMGVYRHGVGSFSVNDDTLKSKKWIDCLVLMMSWCKNPEIRKILYKRYEISILGLYRLTLKEKKENSFSVFKKKIKKIIFKVLSFR